MIIDTDNLRSVEEVADFFHTKLGVAKSYFPTLIYRGKVTGNTVTIYGRDFFVINPAAEDWDIKVDVKATKEK